MNIDHLTKEDKEKLVHYLMRCYRHAKTNVQYMEECDMVNEKKEEYRSEKKTCLLIHQTMMEMNQELREVLEWEFVQKKGIKEMLEKHSRSNYYRLRNEAVDDFLRCL